MKITFYYLLLIILCLLIISCNKEDDQSIQKSNFDCEFVENQNSIDGILDETEIEMIRNCRDNEITNKSDITSNLIGEWELVGFGDGWFSNVTQPCGYLRISDNELTFEFHNEYLDTISVHQWEIENNWLKVQPGDKHLSMNLFCSQYMIGSFSDFGVHTFDVDQYIYKKVK